MGAYYPSCVVNLRLKFDPTLTVRAPPPTLPWPSENPSQVVSTPGNPRPLILQAESGVSWVMARVPKTLSYEKPGYRQAQKFNMELDYRELPIDPRTVRACAVEVHLGTVAAFEFARGFDGDGRDATGRRRSVLQTRDESGGPNAETLRMVGVVDEWEVSHSGRGSTVTIEGRDLRGVLLDTPIGPGGTDREGVRGGKVSDRQLLDTILWDEPINKVVMQILSFNPFFEDMQVICNPEDWPGGEIPSPGLSKGGVIRHRLGARGKKKGAPQKPDGKKSNLNFWDLIVRSCFITGAIPYMIGPNLAIRPSSTVYDKLRGPLDPQKNPTPFAGGKVRARDAITGEAIEPLRARRIVYGRDTKTVRVQRKFGGWRKPQVVRTVSVDLSATSSENQLVQGIWPPEAYEAARATSQTPGKDRAKEEVVTVPVPGVKDQDRLKEIAHAIYEEIGRGELGGECVTTNLASFGGDNADPDLLRLEPGDGVEFLVDTQAVRSGIAPVIASYTDVNRESLERVVSELMLTTGIEANLARVIMATARGQINELQRFFRVQNVRLAWDATSGVKISFDFQNYVVARAQIGEASAAAGEAVSVTTTSGAAGADSPPGSIGNL